MKQYILPAIKFLVFLGLGILLIWLVVRDLTEKQKEEIFIALTTANYSWVVFAMLAGVMAHFSRAVRWKMLMAPLCLVPKTSNTFYAVMIGYLGNLALPRLGEVLRCGILKRYENIPLTQSFGTVIAERVIDMFTLIIIFVFSAWVKYERMHTYLSENIVYPLKNKLHVFMENKLMFFLLSTACLGVILILFFFRKKILKNHIAQKVQSLLLSFSEGIRAVAKVNSPLLFLFHSVFIWSMYLLSVYFCVFAFTETSSLSITDCLAIMAFGSLGVIATPGGIGAYHWIVLQILMLWGYSTAIGVAFGWIAWLAQVVVVLVIGLISFGMLAIGDKENAPNP